MKAREYNYMWLMSYEEQLKAVARTLSGAELKSVVHNEWIDIALFEGEGGNIFSMNIDDELTREELRDKSRDAGIKAPDEVPSLDYYVTFIHKATGQQSEESYSFLYEDLPSLALSYAGSFGVTEKELDVVGEWREEKSDS